MKLPQSMKLERSPHRLTLSIFALGIRLTAGFIVGLGLLILVSVRLENLAPVFPAAFLIWVGLHLLREYGGTTIAVFDKAAGSVAVHHHKLLGAKTEVFDLPLADVVDVYVEDHVRTGLRERSQGCDETVINHYFYLVMKLKDGSSFPLTRSGDGNGKAKYAQESTAQAIKQFLDR